MTRTPAINKPAPSSLSGEASARGLPNNPKWSKSSAAMVWPVITAANQGSEPTRGTKISELVTKTTPIAPPHHIHQGKSRRGAVKTGGKALVPTDSTKRMSVPLANEMSDACRGCSRYLPNWPFTLGCAPKRHPATKPIRIATMTIPNPCT